MLGCLVGLIIQQYVFKSQPTIKEYIIFISMILVFSVDRIYKLVNFVFLTSYLIVIPFTWVYGKITWYEPFICLYILIAVIYNVFIDNKVKYPLLIEEGDIERFPIVSETT